MIGIFDSGVGGLSIYSELKKIVPEAAIVYYSDHANFPYGEKTQEELAVIVDNAAKKLLEYGANPIVVACNSATVSTIAVLRDRYPQTTFVGVEPAVKVATCETKTGIIGVLATKKTVNTHNSDSLCIGKVIFKHFSPELIDKIENGIMDIMDADIRAAIDPLIAKNIDTLVLGCTHFHFIEDRIRSIYKSLKVIEPSAAVAKRAVEVSNDVGVGHSVFMTSGNKDTFGLFLNQNFGKGDYDIREV